MGNSGKEGIATMSDDLREVEPGVYSVLWGATSIEARVVPVVGAYEVHIDCERFTIQLHDPRNGSGRTTAAIGGGRQNLSSAMPGKVVQVLVEEGRDVEAGQNLIVVEAMKMQNALKAAKSGKVTKINARTGATVAAGEVLLVIDY